MSFPADQPLTPTRAGARPQPLSSRTASMSGAYPQHSPDAQHQLPRAHSLHSPVMSSSGYHAAVTPRSAAGSPPGSYHFSPRRKRQSMGDHSPATPQRMRRRLFFGDSSETGAPEDQERRRAVVREAGESALAIIREAVEVGDTHIDLSDLQLDSVPDELAELKHLVSLAPSHTMVTSLQLVLSSNSLSHFPLAICELTNLTTLIISNNRILHLPPEISNLVNLRELSLAHNKLRQLPVEISTLSRLETLSLFPNPFLEPASTDSPASAHELALRSYLSARCRSSTLSHVRPFRMVLTNAGVPRLADFAARCSPRSQLCAHKHLLAQCLELPRPALGRIVGPALEPNDCSVLSALRSQHLHLPTSAHRCANCKQWFLLPPVEIVVWTNLPLVKRQVPLKVRLCCRNCIYSQKVGDLLTTTCTC
ncbi:hypothetical protein GGI04_002008 [Coemansia thaxteri]|uniref:Uncharacterized protein n=1 Tax=Coemansia thaxteri TaxID=2663907 RepID=A0A9W8EHM7_9FUNG|nr:hypothetical protein H4R26_004975 [Coemansia thaxteri]KAJ2006063.1 hypothetical protein GGI04_002008 [Coemansia thaxteri]KAJ2471983.1 hypothetical protein GGI02_001895 [Coemansia sp. RSA 2322]KAJ2479338.1 hypothetical protein EV174_004047 [Coemansia sp. RSA 2320]